MESENWNSDRAAAALADAEASRMALAGTLGRANGFLAALGLAIATNIAVVAVGIARQNLWLPAVGVAIFGIAAGIVLWMIRRASGVWVAGFASRVVFGTGAIASAAYAAAFAAAIWAAFTEHWWLVAAASVAGGAAYAFAGRRWLNRYHHDPEHHQGAESAAALAAMLIATVVGLAVLLLAS